MTNQILCRRRPLNKVLVHPPPRYRVPSNILQYQPQLNTRYLHSPTILNQQQLSAGNLHSSGDSPRPVINYTKHQRCRWTPELHALFVEVINQLGGPLNATPKCIQFGMKVKGLTLFQIKSHLQKFRLGKLVQGTKKQQYGKWKKGKKEVLQQMEISPSNEMITFGGQSSSPPTTDYSNGFVTNNEQMMSNWRLEEEMEQMLPSQPDPQSYQVHGSSLYPMMGNFGTNVGNFVTNAGNIVTNAGNFVTNAGNFVTNAGNFGTNAGTNGESFGTNGESFGTNVESIGTNGGSFGTNGGSFGTNAGNFGTNAGTNVGSIGTNVGSFGTNVGSFGTNVGSFGTNVGSFGTNVGSFGTNGGSFGTNGGYFETNGGSFETNGGSFGTNVGDVSDDGSMSAVTFSSWNPVSPSLTSYNLQDPLGYTPDLTSNEYDYILEGLVAEDRLDEPREPEEDLLTSYVNFCSMDHYTLFGDSNES